MVRRLVALIALTLAVNAVAWAASGSGPAGAAAGRAPDLVVRGIGTQPSSLVAGDAFRARATVHNVGRRAASGATLTFLLSRDENRSAGDAVLGRRSVPRIPAGRQQVLASTLSIPPAATGRRFLIACANRADGEQDVADNCAAVARRIAPAPPTGPENPEADPISVDPALETAAKVTGTIGPDGGTLETTGADGTEYELVVPPDALVSPVEVGMTPIAGLGGSPYDGQVDGVSLTPDGLHLANPATLRITPANLLPEQHRSPFAYRSDGADFVLALGDAVGAAYEMPLLHLGGHGVAQGTPEQRATVAGSEPASLQWKQDNEVARDVLAGPPHVQQLVADDFVAHYDGHLRPGLVHATTASIGQLEQARTTAVELITHTRQLRMLGVDRADVDQRVAAGMELVRRVANNMLAKGWSACLDDHRPAHVLSALALERHARLAGLSTQSGDVFDPHGYVSRCVRFELVVRGMYVYNPSSGLPGLYTFYAVGYQGTIPLEVGGGPAEGGVDGLEVGGEAPLTAFRQDYATQCLLTPCDPVGGSGMGAVFDTPAQVVRLDPDLSVVVRRGPGGRPVSDPERKRAIVVHYLPGTTTEVWDVGGYLHQRDAYESVFREIHAPERDTTSPNQHYVLADWQLLGGEHWAHAEYVNQFVCAQSDDSPYTGCKIGFRENSTFDLVHTPDATG